MRDFPKDDKPKPKHRRDPSAEKMALGYLSSRRGRPIPPVSRDLGAIAQKFAPSSKTNTKPQLQQLKNQWREIMGENIAKLSSPDGIRGKTLIIRAIGAATPLLQMRSKEILGLASLACGIELNKLSFVQTKIEKPKSAKPQPTPLDAEAAQKLEAKLAPISNSRLKNAIRMLNAYIQTKA